VRRNNQTRRSARVLLLAFVLPNRNIHAPDDRPCRYSVIHRRPGTPVRSTGYAAAAPGHDDDVPSALFSGIAVASFARDRGFAIRPPSIAAAVSVERGREARHTHVEPCDLSFGIGWWCAWPMSVGSRLHAVWQTLPIDSADSGCSYGMTGAGLITSETGRKLSHAPFRHERARDGSVGK